MLRDILQESWTYQKIHGDGFVEGIEGGLVETAHKSIITVAQARFPELLAYVKDQVAPLTDENQLQNILSMIATARAAVDVKQAFSTFRLLRRTASKLFRWWLSKNLTFLDGLCYHCCHEQHYSVPGGATQNCNAPGR